jgi:hypothetical protein
MTALETLETMVESYKWQVEELERDQIGARAKQELLRAIIQNITYQIARLKEENQ